LHRLPNVRRARILLADDHEVVIQGLRRVLEPTFEIVGVAMDGRALVNAAAQLQPDVIVTDLTMPRLNGLEAARQILHENPAAKIVFLTMHSDATYAAEALDTGALGYVPKNSAGLLLVKAIREALQDRVYVPRAIMGPVQGRSGRTAGPVGPKDHRITARQMQVVRLYAEGHTTKDIAEVLHLSVRTVEFHKYRAMAALGLKSSAELIRFAAEHLK
jgi:DNA-binding NarL/FixJ family response regulator